MVNVTDVKVIHFPFIKQIIPDIKCKQFSFIEVFMLSRHLFSRSILAIAISQAALSGIAIAEESTVLDELKIEGRAITELDQTISSDDIANNQTTDLEGLFRNKSEVTAGGSVKMGQKIYVRNIGEDSLNITIDGAEQAGGVFHHAGRITIEPELLKRVEIEAGAANATSGPGALGGSVRFVTKDASDLLDPDQDVGALLKSSFSSNGGGLKNSVTVYGRTDSGKTEGMLHLTDSSHDNYEDGNGDELDGTELDETLGFAKIKTQLTDEQTLSITHENVTEEGDVLYKPELFANSKNVAEPTTGERQTTTLNYGFMSKNNDLIDAKVTIYQTNNEQSREYSGTNYTGNVETLGLTLENTSIVSQHELTYGLNHREDESYFYESKDYIETGTVTGLYVQDNVDISDKLMLSAGVRYDQYELTDINNSDFSDGGFSPNVGAVYRINSQLDITANYAQALRGPEIKDAFKLSSGISNSSGLAAETSKNFEIGANYRKNHLAVGAGVYKSTIEDGIGTETPWGKVYDNFEEDIETTGFYLDVTYQLEKLTAGLHFHSADTLQGDEIVTRYTHSSTATSIGDTLVLNLDYQFNQTFNAGWSAEMVKGIYNIDQTVGTDELTIDKPGYATHNIYAKWLPLGDDQLTLSLAINNLFDKQYLSHASVEDYTGNAGWETISGSAAPGRDIRLSAALKF